MWLSGFTNAGSLRRAIPLKVLASDRCNDGRLRIGHLIGETGLILSGCSPTFGSTATLAFSGVDGFGDALGDAMLRIGGDPVIG